MIKKLLNIINSCHTPNNQKKINCQISKHKFMTQKNY